MSEHYLKYSDKYNKGDILRCIENSNGINNLFNKIGDIYIVL